MSRRLPLETSSRGRREQAARAATLRAPSRGAARLDDAAFRALFRNPGKRTGRDRFVRTVTGFAIRQFARFGAWPARPSG